MLKRSQLVTHAPEDDVEGHGYLEGKREVVADIHQEEQHNQHTIVPAWWKQ